MPASCPPLVPGARPPGAGPAGSASAPTPCPGAPPPGYRRSAAPRALRRRFLSEPRQSAGRPGCCLPRGPRPIAGARCGCPTSRPGSGRGRCPRKHRDLAHVALPSFLARNLLPGRLQPLHRGDVLSALEDNDGECSAFRQCVPAARAAVMLAGGHPLDSLERAAVQCAVQALDQALRLVQRPLHGGRLAQAQLPAPGVTDADPGAGPAGLGDGPEEIAEISQGA